MKLLLDMRDPDASDFCYYPFFQVLISAEGKYKVCSKHYDHITHEGKVLTTQNATIKEAWESDYMQDIRKSFHENKRYPGCVECWRMQKMGLRSMRYHSYQYGIPESQVENPEAPMRIETNSSNVCNLRCRICFATASTKWLQEAIDLYDYKEQVHLNMHMDNLEQVKQWAGNLIELALFGGEPLLMDENFQLLDYLIETGHSSHINLLFNTNGTVFDPSITERLRKFRKIRMSFSIDDLYERFEYQRKGADWKEVEQNIHTAYNMMQELGPEQFDFKICISVSLFNVYYLPEFFEYFNREFPGLIIYFNYIYDPSRFNVQILPKELKSMLLGRLKSIEIDPSWKGKDGELMNEFIPYLEHDEAMPFAEFFRIVNRHDVYRKESFHEVFPEWWNKIKEYCPNDVIMGEAETPFVERTSQWLESDAFLQEFDAARHDLAEKFNGNGKTDINSLALMIIFEEKKKQTEMIHLPNLYYGIMNKLGAMDHSFSVPASDKDWVRLYLLHTKAFADHSTENKMNGPLEQNIQWIADHVSQTDMADKLFSDLLSTPAQQLAGDLSRTNPEKLQLVFEERY